MLHSGHAAMVVRSMSLSIVRHQDFSKPDARYEWNKLNRLPIGYHARWVLAFSTVVLSVFAMSLVSLHIRRWKLAASIIHRRGRNLVLGRQGFLSNSELSNAERRSSNPKKGS